MISQMNELKTSNANMAKMAWSICSDAMYSREIMLTFQPHKISAAAIYIASEFLLNSIHLTTPSSVTEQDIKNEHTLAHSNGTSPVYRSFSNQSSALSPLQNTFDGTKEPNWWRRFDIEDEDIRRISMHIMDLYESPFAKFKDEQKEKQKTHGLEDEDIDMFDLKTPSPTNKSK